jgi:hypothetical protein
MASCVRLRDSWHLLFGGVAMTDNLKNRGPADRARINVNESWEVRWWCGHFGCTESQLRDAVKAVGVMADKVRRHLGK